MAQMIVKFRSVKKTMMRFSIFQQKFFRYFLGGVGDAREMKLASPAQAIRQTRQGHDSRLRVAEGFISELDGASG